jgi:dTDP-4-dehydrorhamnose 3,5-epimerase
VLSEEAIFTYKVDNVYAPQSEASIRYDDATIGVDWPISSADVMLSDKDLNKAVPFAEAEVFE